MSELTIDNFAAFFEELHGHPPYPWQSRLAVRAAGCEWPGAIDLPTGSGKTACIDIAIFALACQASLPVAQRLAPRRIFFCVNRRVIVDEACRRAEDIARKIWRAERGEDSDKPTLQAVGRALRTIAGTSRDDDGPPLDVIELRGGIYRDNRWARSVTQPTVVCTTIDQLGSRLLFRGYGVSRGAAPIQAALIAYDSLVLLDEAHISEPFRQTLDRVGLYLDPDKWAQEDIGVRAMRIVPMTATPSEAMRQGGVLELEKDDRANESLRPRLAASKRARLRDPNSKSVAKLAVEEATRLASGEPRALGIMVNRVVTAREIFNTLQSLQRAGVGKNPKIDPSADIELVIGSMRPLDRDEQGERLWELIGPDRPDKSVKTSFVVATQCLEVGADYDFDVLITECASLDALRQRFGRLNRAGRPIEAEAVILIDKKNLKPDGELDDDKPADPIYGNALARTWNWLNLYATKDESQEKPQPRIDFGIDAFDQLLREHEDNGRMPEKLLPPSASLNAPVMLPAYIDLWCQTSPRPMPDPYISLFLHGPQRGEPDVQVCWRADLVEDGDLTQMDWAEVVALLPPTAAECMSVPISRVRRWLASEDKNLPDSGDTLEARRADEGEESGRAKHPGVLWRGPKDSELLKSPADLRPGDTLVLPASDTNSRLLGHLPELVGFDREAADAQDDESGPRVRDIAEDAFGRSRDKAALRLHPALREILPDSEAFTKLTDAAGGEDPPTWAGWKDMLREAVEALDESNAEQKNLRQRLANLAKSKLTVLQYPRKNDGRNRGTVLILRERMGSSDLLGMPTDDGDDESSRTDREQPVLLDAHTEHVHATAQAGLDQLPLSSFSGVFGRAAELHDLGKADDRFQAMLRDSNRSHAWLAWGGRPPVWAKSPAGRSTLAEYKRSRARSELPSGFRHEMLSVQLAEHAAELPQDPAHRDLILHLIAAHHGHARPFAPVVPDEELPDIESFSVPGTGGVRLSHERRAALAPPHRLDSGIAERFWALTRRYGWWGLAYLEAVLRLADQQASAAEDTGIYEDEQTEQPAEAAT